MQDDKLKNAKSSAIAKKLKENIRKRRLQKVARKEVAKVKNTTD